MILMASYTWFRCNHQRIYNLLPNKDRSLPSCINYCHLLWSVFNSSNESSNWSYIKEGAWFHHLFPGIIPSNVTTQLVATQTLPPIQPDSNNDADDKDDSNFDWKAIAVTRVAWYPYFKVNWGYFVVQLKG